MSFKDDLKSWDPQDVKPINLEEMDKAIEELGRAKEAYDEVNAKSKMLFATYEDARMKVLEYLQAAGKSKYHVDGVGLVSVVNNKRIKMPEDPKDRQTLLEFVESREGISSISVNYQVLNRIYKECLIEAEERGEVFEMPGAGTPEIQQTISFRRS